MRSLFNPALASLMLAIGISCSAPKGKEILVRGIYGHPGPIWEQGYSLDELGVNAIFVHSGSITDEMIIRARQEGQKIYAEFATLNGKNYVEEHPEAWAIDSSGNRVEPASWFMGVCPTNPEFKKHRLSQLEELLKKHDIDGIWMDYVHWHAQFEEPEPILPETCFCDHCIDQFATEKNLDIPGNTTKEIAGWILENEVTAWRGWRCQVIYEWALDMRTTMDRYDQGLLLGLYHCPWNDNEYDSARINILGLDYNLLKPVVDVFSPMVYHGRMGREPGWVANNIQWFSDRYFEGQDDPKIWPIVQAYNDPGIITADEFIKVMEGGLSGASSGVMMFTSRAVADDPQKIEAMKKFYHSFP